MSGHQSQKPFRSGAGRPPPYLSDRKKEIHKFRKLLRQNVIREHISLTGLSGVGKTAFFDTFSPTAIRDGWRWVGAYGRYAKSRGITGVQNDGWTSIANAGVFGLFA